MKDKGPAPKRLPMLMGLLGVMGAAALVDRSLQAETQYTRTPKPFVRHDSATTSTFSRRDYEAKFPTLQIRPPDVFQPQVIGAKRGSLDALRKDNDHVPPALVNNEANWAYVNFGKINGKMVAGFENQATQQTHLLMLGETWFGTSLVEADDGHVVLRSSAGEDVTVARIKEEKPAPENAPAAPGGPGGMPATPPNP
ncbi:MAG: hypothetical protein JSS72_08915 [Armatimonadetes bacterium]|nr:hypothetical protein [Armatimonadota bacterium]